MAKIIGIDLGTTNSCVAALDESGVPRALASPDGERTTPSVVAFTDSGVVVGIPARRQAVTNPQRTIFGTKRLIGRKVNADDVSWFARTAPFRIVAAPNGDAWVRIGDRPTSPQEVAAHVLRRMREVAEQELGEPVTRAIVTVPAYFNDAQRQATRDAGTIAGLDVIRILNEPTAAALAYGAHLVGEGRRVIAVFDLGGGTFDVSIMAVENDVFEVLSTNGDSALGGDDWDRRLIETLADEIFDHHRVNVTGIPVAMGRLKEACEKAKRILSYERETEIDLPYLVQTESADPIHIMRRITRDELERLTADLLDRLRNPVERAIADAGFTPAEIDDVLLVGGMSRMPKVQELVEQMFGRKPSKGANPDEVVAVGAATYAGILGGEANQPTLLDVTPHTIGIRVGDSGFAAVIPRNSMLPVRQRKVFTTTRDEQDHVRVEIYQGESTDIRLNRKLGEVTLHDLPTGRAGAVKIELFITVDVESILHVAARETTTGNEAAVRIVPSGGLSETEMIRIVEESRARAARDRG